jgi:hypothetical protein
VPLPGKMRLERQSDSCDCRSQVRNKVLNCFCPSGVVGLVV